VRIVALITTHNEERFIGKCIEHLRDQGVDVHLTDNDSTDRTVEIARGYLGRGVVGIDHLPRDGHKDLQAMLRHAEELASSLAAEWFIRQDADEFRVSPQRGRTLAEELQEADERGRNAVAFMEFTFVPWAEEPDHDHPRFRETMRRYYPFLPAMGHNITAFKPSPGGVDLRSTWGQAVRFDDQRISPWPLWSRHYQWLSVDHALEKYARHNPRTVGPDNWRDHELRREHVVLPAGAELRPYEGDHRLDPSEPRRIHVLHRGMLTH
jgi:glycosyltransferase involved in cell wall biosynthesis